MGDGMSSFHVDLLLFGALWFGTFAGLFVFVWRVTR